jgi:hypothetical protein
LRRVILGDVGLDVGDELLRRVVLLAEDAEEDDTCEDDTCMRVALLAEAADLEGEREGLVLFTVWSYEEEDTCMSYEEEDTCMPYEEEDTCMLIARASYW